MVGGVRHHNGGVIEVRAVVEAKHDLHVPDWPVVPRADGFVEVSGRMSREDVADVLAAIVQLNEADDGPDGPAMFRELLEDPQVVARGGLSFRDTGTGDVVGPTCCEGVSFWREWLVLLDGRIPCIGHDPLREIEFDGGVLRLREWSGPERTDGPVCEIPVAQLPVLFEGVRQDLADFLDLVRKWAPYGLGERLAALFDEQFQISEPAVGTHL
jgi:hypothetical protein